MFKRFLAILMAIMLPALLLSSAAFAVDAVDVTVNLSASRACPGESVTVFGTADAATWVSVKVLDSAGNIVFFDAVKSGSGGDYSLDFKVPSGDEGDWIIVAGYGSDVATVGLTVTETKDPGPGPGPGSSGGGGGGTPASQPVDSLTGAAAVDPGAGGKISLGGEAAINIPAGALKETDKLEVKIQKVSAPPSPAAGFRVLGTVYEFTVDGKAGYSFAKPVTLTFTFDPAALAPGESPSIHYYDETSLTWVRLGGAVSGNTITVTVDHFTKFAVMAVEKKTEAGTVETGIALTDIAGHWAEGNIKQLLDSGAISGYPDSTFKPDNNITRAEFAAVLVKACQLESKTGKIFDDTSVHWAKEAIATAEAYGIVNGYSTAIFGPDDSITREQMAVMIVKAARLALETGVSTFGDSDKIAGWAQQAVATAGKRGIISGYPDSTFRPQGQATRAEAATVIVKALD